MQYLAIRRKGRAEFNSRQSVQFTPLDTSHTFMYCALAAASSAPSGEKARPGLNCVVNGVKDPHLTPLDTSIYSPLSLLLPAICYRREGQVVSRATPFSQLGHPPDIVGSDGHCRLWYRCTGAQRGARVGVCVGGMRVLVGVG